MTIYNSPSVNTQFLKNCLLPARTWLLLWDLCQTGFGTFECYYLNENLRNLEEEWYKKDQKRGFWVTGSVPQTKYISANPKSFCSSALPSFLLQLAGVQWLGSAQGNKSNISQFQAWPLKSSWNPPSLHSAVVILEATSFKQWSYSTRKMFSLYQATEIMS